MNLDDIDHKDIAVIGMSGRFPKAPDIQTFWHNLKEGIEGLTLFSDEELMVAGVDAKHLNDPNYIKAGMILEDIDKFDASFFGYTPSEAALLDPQQRLFMEQAWHTMENAGYSSQTYDGWVGIYAGVAWNTYLLSNLTTHTNLFAPETIFQTFITSDKDFMPTRVSYKFNLKGPSMVIQTSCSTSLVAIHLACLGLINYECDIALAGGATVKIPQVMGYYYTEGGLVSPDGHCRTFDAKGQGTIFGSGIGVVALKRLREALEDGDPVRAVIKGSAINNDGSLKVSYTAPSVEGQAEAIASALTMADVPVETIGYIETHGTATSLGDPIEVTALNKVFKEVTDKRAFCALGSVKSNVGHLDAAAGVTGFIKTVLALENKQIPPSLHYETPNPAIDFVNSPFYVCDRLQDWILVNDTPRRAGVSSFGVGGTNAHVILEEAPVLLPTDKGRTWQALLLSAQNEGALNEMATNLATFLAETPGVSLADTAYTLQMGRTAFSHRRMIMAQDKETSVARLNEQGVTAVAPEDPPPVVFLCSGQGSQYVNMGRDLYEDEPLFRQWVDTCAHHLQPHLGLDLRSLLYPDPAHLDPAQQQLTETHLAQPAIFTISYAMAQLWQTWGIIPHALIGHSIGEYVAACLAGVFSLEDALHLVVIRGRLMQQMDAGAMLAVSLPEREVRSFTNDKVSLAAVNTPSLCTLSGSTEAIAVLEQRLTNESVTYRRLYTSHAFHSHMMEPILEKYETAVARVRRDSPNIPFISNVSGTWITEAEARDPAYWANHIRRPVRFSEGLDILFQEASWLLLEVGPGRTLGTLARQHSRKTVSQTILASLRHPRDEQPDMAFLTTTIGRLWLAGASLDWPAFYKGQRRQRVPLPGYPFQREHHWIDAQTRTVNWPVQLPGKQADPDTWFYLPSWRRSVCPSADGGPQHWLIFADKYGFGQLLAEFAQTAGHTVTLVQAGSHYETQPGAYTLDPAIKTHYQTLWQTVADVDHILYCWSLSDGRDDQPQSAYYSLLALSQTWPLDMKAHLTLLTNWGQVVSGETHLIPEQALVLSLNRVLSQESTQLHSRSIDLDWLPHTSLPQRLMVLLWRDLTAGIEPLTVYRNCERWLPTYEATRLPEQSDWLQPNSVYLFTEGLTGLGRVLTGQLAKLTIQPRLLLLDSGLPDAAHWETWLNSHADWDETSQRILHVRRLEALGADVWVLATDVTSETAVRSMLQQVKVQWNRLDGVLHTAGISGERIFRTIQETGQTESEWHFQPKIGGVQTLKKVLQEESPKFCLLCSSLSAILGGRGYAAYAASNLYLDLFAHASNRNSAFPWITLNWDAWQGEVENMAGINATLTASAMSEAEVGQVLRRVLGGETSVQLITSTTPLDVRMAQWQANIDKAKERFITMTKHPRPALPTPYISPSTDLEKLIVQVWQDTLGFERVGTQDNFFELGGDSLVAIRVVSLLKEKLNMEIPAAKLYQGATVEYFAQLIAQDEAETTKQQVEAFADRKDKMAKRRQMQRRHRKN